MKHITLSVCSLYLLTVLAPLASAAPAEVQVRAAKKNPKRGIAFPLAGNTADLSKAANSAISWEYDWAVNAPAKLPAGVEHVPMQHGKADIEKLEASVKKSKAKVVLGFNEPERPDQANLSPSDAAQLWQKYINPLSKEGVRLGAPAVSSAPEGKAWLKNFMDQCKNCHIDFIPLHWYGQGSQYFLQYLEDMHKTFPKYKIWVTEYADTTMNNAGTVESFLKTTIQKMDSLDYIERYAWFDYSRSTPGMQSNLLDGSGNLNALGKAYV